MYLREQESWQHLGSVARAGHCPCRATGTQGNMSRGGSRARRGLKPFCRGEDG